MTQSRWKSKYLWLAVIAIICFALGNWGLYDKIGITEDGISKLFDLIWIALASLGVVNNPTDGENW